MVTRTFLLCVLLFSTIAKAQSDDSFLFSGLVGVADVKVKTLLNGGDQPSAATSAWQLSPFIGGAVHSNRLQKHKLGLVVHYSEADDIALWSIRPLDYKYLIVSDFNLKLFFGVSRYDRETPAHGYYLGTGVEWTGWREDIGFNVEAAYGDKIARDRVLSTDPVREKADDIFYDVYSLNTYISFYF